MLDRFFDNYVMTPQGKFVFDALRPSESRDPYSVEEARKMLDASYAWLDRRMQTQTSVVGESFTLADCAAAPSLFYADWTYRIPERRETSWPIGRGCCSTCPSRERWMRRAVSVITMGAPDRD